MCQGTLYMLSCTMLTRRLWSNGLPNSKRRNQRAIFLHVAQIGSTFFDGHDKLMGYQNSTFPIAIYGCIDTCSRKILWEKVWSSNSDPNLVGQFYLEYLYKTRWIASRLRLDKGSETGGDGHHACVPSAAPRWHGPCGNCHLWAINYKSG